MTTTLTRPLSFDTAVLEGRWTARAVGIWENQTRYLSSDRSIPHPPFDDYFLSGDPQVTRPAPSLEKTRHQQAWRPFDRSFT